jgi:hypothetical protein
MITTGLLILFSVAFGYVCILDEHGAAITRLVGHVGGGLWLILAGGLLPSWIVAWANRKAAIKLGKRTSDPKSASQPNSTTKGESK